MPRAIEFKLGGTLQFLMEPEDYAAVYFTIKYRDFTITAVGKDMAYTLASGMQVHVQVSYVDANGNPAVVDGAVRWDTSDSSTVNVVVDANDSSKATVGAPGATGQAQVTATADADLGDGIRAIITPMDVEVVSGEAVSGVIAPVGGAEPIPQHR